MIKFIINKLIKKKTLYPNDRFNNRFFIILYLSHQSVNLHACSFQLVLYYNTPYIYNQDYKNYQINDIHSSFLGNQIFYNYNLFLIMFRLYYYYYQHNQILFNYLIIEPLFIPFINYYESDFHILNNYNLYKYLLF